MPSISIATEDFVEVQPSLALPKFTIVRAEDNNLLWDPPLKSRELADALSYRYPMEETLQKKMQRATLDFLNSERKRPLLSEMNSQTVFSSSRSDPPLSIPLHANTKSIPPHEWEPTSENIPTHLNHFPNPPGSTNPVWNLRTGHPVKNKGRNGPLSPEKRQKVTNNRGNVCDYHKRSKGACDPDACPSNKLNNHSNPETGTARGLAKIDPFVSHLPGYSIAELGDTFPIDSTPIDYMNGGSHEILNENFVSGLSLDSGSLRPCNPVWRTTWAEPKSQSSLNGFTYPQVDLAETSMYDFAPELLGSDFDLQELHQELDSSQYPLPFQFSDCEGGPAADLDIETMERSGRPRRRRYDPEERREVAWVRKIGACAECRLRKVKRVQCRHVLNQASSLRPSTASAIPSPNSSDWFSLDWSTISEQPSFDMFPPRSPQILEARSPFSGCNRLRGDWDANIHWLDWLDHRDAPDTTLSKSPQQRSPPQQTCPPIYFCTWCNSGIDPLKCLSILCCECRRRIMLSFISDMVYAFYLIKRFAIHVMDLISVVFHSRDYLASYHVQKYRGI